MFCIFGTENVNKTNKIIKSVNKLKIIEKQKTKQKHLLGTPDTSLNGRNTRKARNAFTSIPSAEICCTTVDIRLLKI